MSQVLATRVKQIAAGVLDVGVSDVGPADGPAVVLLHGWPYDIHTFDEVSPLLAAAGYRVIVGTLMTGAWPRRRSSVSYCGSPSPRPIRQR